MKVVNSIILDFSSLENTYSFVSMTVYLSFSAQKVTVEKQVC